MPCPKCGSFYTYYGLKKEAHVCRKCGNIYTTHEALKALKKKIK